MLSELEHAVLGVALVVQPCTAYAARVVFQRSPPVHWSGSAGAIYPLIWRLERGRLLRSAARRGDKRGTRLYRFTDSGVGKLRAWLRPSLPAGFGSDQHGPSTSPSSIPGRQTYSAKNKLMIQWS